MLLDSRSRETEARRMGWLRASNFTMALDTTLTTWDASALVSRKTRAPPAASGAWSRRSTTCVMRAISSRGAEMITRLAAGSDMMRPLGVYSAPRWLLSKSVASVVAKVARAAASACLSSMTFISRGWTSEGMSSSRTILAAASTAVGSPVITKLLLRVSTSTFTAWVWEPRLFSTRLAMSEAMAVFRRMIRVSSLALF